MAEISRRLFLGLIGGTIVATSMRSEFELLRAEEMTRWPGPRPAPQSWRLVEKIWVHAHEPGMYEIQRAAGPTLLACPLQRGGVFCWESMINSEFVMRPGEPMICLAGPADPDWSIDWRERGGPLMRTASQGWTEAFDL